MIGLYYEVWLEAITCRFVCCSLVISVEGAYSDLCGDGIIVIS